MRQKPVAHTRPISSAPSSASPGRFRRMLAVVTVLVLIGGALLFRLLQERANPPALAMSELERRAREQPNDLQAQLDWGSALQKTGQLEAAGQVFEQAAKLAPQDAQVYLWQGIVAVQRRQSEKAISCFLLSLRYHPNDPDVWHALAKEYARTHDLNHALDAYEHVVQLRPSDAVAWREVGALDMQRQRYARGRKALLRATQLNPVDMQAQTLLGTLDTIVGQLPEAKQAFDRVLTHDPNNAQALAGMAKVALQLDPSPAGLQRAEQQVRQALALQPSGEAHLTLGRIHLLRREYAPAIDALKGALSADPRLTSAYVFLSQAYAASGRPDLARSATRDYQAAQARGSTPKSGAGGGGDR